MSAEDCGGSLISLTATLAERAMVRYSPAGVPVLECRLAHRSVQPEAGVDRAVEFEIGAVGLGDIVKDIDRIAPGTEITVQGFLAPSRKSSKTLLLHITRIKSLESIELEPRL